MRTCFSAFSLLPPFPFPRCEDAAEEEAEEVEEDEEDEEDEVDEAKEEEEEEGGEEEDENRRVLWGGVAPWRWRSESRRRPLASVVSYMSCSLHRDVIMCRVWRRCCVIGKTQLGIG